MNDVFSLSNRYAGKDKIEVWREFLSDVDLLKLSPGAFQTYMLMMTEIDKRDRGEV